MILLRSKWKTTNLSRVQKLTISKTNNHIIIIIIIIIKKKNNNNRNKYDGDIHTDWSQNTWNNRKDPEKVTK